MTGSSGHSANALAVVSFSHFTNDQKEFIHLTSGLLTVVSLLWKIEFDRNIDSKFLFRLSIRCVWMLNL